MPVQRGPAFGPACAVALSTLAAFAMTGPFAATSAALPAGMAYEKVTPAQKGDANVGFARRTAISSTSGDRLAFRSDVAFAGARGALWPVDYVAERHGSQWITHPITPAQDPDVFGIAIGPRRGVHEFTPDLRRVVLVQRDPGLVPGAARGVLNLYEADLPPADPGYQLLTPPPLAPVGIPFFDLVQSPAVAAVSPDASRVVFESNFQLTSDANPGITNVYEWSAGTTRLVSLLPGDATPADNAVVGRGAQPIAPQNHAGETDRAVSADGSRIVFTVGSSGTGGAYSGRVFVRIGGRVTKEASASQLPVPEPPQPATYLTASADGRYVYFTSCEKLVVGSTADCSGSGKIDLYRFDVDNEDLVDLTADPAAPSITGIVGSDPAVSYLYLAGGSGQFGLFLLHDDTLRAIPPSAYEGDATLDLNATSQLGRQAAVSPDGRLMVFSTQTSTANRELYLYNGDTGTVRCVSCLPGGAASSGTSSLGVNTPADSELVVSPGGTSSQTRLPRNFDNTGGKLFFQTSNRLLPEDDNGRTDVYRYDVATGAVELISTGKGRNQAFFMDANVDGTAVFFATANRVIEGLDDDDFIDLYVARVGATPYTAPPSRAECDGTECQGPLFVPGDPGVPGSAAFAGPDDIDEAATPARARVLRIGSVRVSRSGRGRVTVNVRVSDPGRVVLRVSSRIGRVRRGVGGATRTARAGGLLRIPFRLSRAARKQLRARGRLRVQITVEYAGGSGDSAALVLRTTRGSRR